MPKISSLDQKLWPTGRGQTDTQTDRQTEKANTETPFFEFFLFSIFFLRSGSIICDAQNIGIFSTDT